MDNHGNSPRRGRTVGAALVVLLLAQASAALAGPPRRADINDQLKDAELVFLGVVKGIDFRLSQPNAGTGGTPFTFVTYRIQRVLKGQSPGAEITLRFIGGWRDNDRLMVGSEMPLFDVGDRDVLLVRGNGRSICPTVGCSQGRFRVIRERVYGEAGHEVKLAGGNVARGRYHPNPEVLAWEAGGLGTPGDQTFSAGEDRSVGLEEFQSFVTQRIAALGGPGVGAPVASLNVDAPFSFTVRPVAPPPSTTSRPAPTGLTPGDRAEREALLRSGGNPVLPR